MTDILNELDDGWLDTLLDSMQEESPTYKDRFDATRTLIRDYRQLLHMVQVLQLRVKELEETVNDWYIRYYARLANEPQVPRD
jgi:hypothetical protein